MTTIIVAIIVGFLIGGVIGFALGHAQPKPNAGIGLGSILKDAAAIAAAI